MSSDPSAKIESVLQEQRIFQPDQSFADRATIGSLEEYKHIFETARKDPDKFWGEAAKKEFTYGLDEDEEVNAMMDVL